MDVQFVAGGEDELQVVFVHERIVAGRDRNQRLVILDDIRRNLLDVRVRFAINDGRLVFRMQERLYLERDILVLKWLDGLGVNDGGAVKC